MNEVREPGGIAGQADVGEYCRRVEEHLARVNEGHLVRVVGPGFELARSWAHAGVPLAVVFRGIERKAERHRAGRSTRPLRLEFCEADVRDEYETWRRAVGVPSLPTFDEAGATKAEEPRRRPSIGRALDRAIEKLVRAVGRLDVADTFREEAGAVLADLARVRDELRHARGDARAQATAHLGRIDSEIGAVARRAAGPWLAVAASEAAAELAPFKARLAQETWERSLDAGTDRLLRDRFGLPTLDLEEVSNVSN